MKHLPHKNLIENKLKLLSLKTFENASDFDFVME